MVNVLYRRWLLLICLIGLTGCENAETITSLTGTQCTEPKPQMCTMEYRPVCASLADGSKQTFSNGCSACSSTEAVSWTDGGCSL